MRYFRHTSLLAFIVIFFVACDKTTTETLDDFDYKPERMRELIPLQSGKFIVYRLDSTVFTNFGRSVEIHKYQTRHLIDSMYTDNLGRPSYRIFRYLRDTLGVQPWTPDGSYFVTYLNDQVEVIEDNLRFVKNRIPVRDGNTWKGNQYLAPQPYSSLYSFGNDDFMDRWDYEIVGPMESTVSLMGQTYKDVVTVLGIDYSDKIGIPTALQQRSLLVEKYSKNIGLVHKEYTMWDQQPNMTITPNPITGRPDTTYDPVKRGFGIKMWMIDHN